MRPRATPKPRRATLALADRVREVRLDRFGDRGAPMLAAALGLPHRTWMNYEAGVTIPAPVILRFIDITGVSPGWLLDGRCGKHDPVLGSMPVLVGSAENPPEGPGRMGPK